MDLLSKLIVETFPYFKIHLDVSLLNHLLHETAALVKSISTKKSYFLITVCVNMY